MRSLAILLQLLPALSIATLDCKKVLREGVTWNFEKLSGTHAVHDLRHTTKGSESYENATYTIDLCQPLKSAPQGCAQGTRICKTERTHDPKKDGYDPSDPDPSKLPTANTVYTIAGEMSIHEHGGALDPTYTRLKKSDSNEDAKKEGVRITMNGGIKYSHEKGFPNLHQRAIVELLCDRDKTGLEGPDSEAKEDAASRERSRRQVDAARDDDEDDEKDPDKGKDDDGDENEDLEMESPDKGASLRFDDYSVDLSDKLATLRLTWKTKYACEDAAENPDPNDGSSSRGSSGWGFFTWFIIVLFLAIAAYLIFGSWLNYNRYGARGWDLLPHGDTIRDVPYLMKDWGRRVFGGGTFGGGRDLGYIRV